MRINFILLALVPFIISCKSRKRMVQSNAPLADTAYVQNPETGELTMIVTEKNLTPDGEWTLQSIGSEIDDEMQRLSMNIDAKNKKVSGNDACNQYNGQLTELNTKHIKFGPLAATKRACMIPAKHAKIFYKTLEKINSYTATTKLLILKDAKGSNLMTFKRK